MARLMYDSVDADAIPTNAQMVAGYIDGTSYRWSSADWARFPSSVKVRIARRTYTNDGHVLDVEEGIPTVWPLTDPAVRQGIRQWVLNRRNSGVVPTIYCNQLNDWDDIRRVFSEANIAQPLYWVARYNNVRDIPTGAIAKQYANPPLAGGHYDLSTVADHWPGVDTEEDEMQLSDRIPVKLANDVVTTVTVGDVLRGMAQYIGGNAAAPGGFTSHPHGQYVFRIIDLADMQQTTKEIQAAVNSFEPTPVDVDALATALIERLSLPTVKALADELDRRARDGDPSTGPTS